MALLVGKDMATGSFARTFADIDLDDDNQDSVHIDWDNEETKELLMEENQRQLVSDAIDYKGNPADRTASGGWVTATLILVELSERLSTMAIVLNLVTYLVGTMHLSSSTSSNISTNLGGTSYMLCLLGGILADTFLTRYRTIAIFAVVNAMRLQPRLYDELGYLLVSSLNRAAEAASTAL
ncbi:protein NRT1/ PTR FAMILY 6.2-like [Gossypium arboreum]|uniref:protein NRT1/ PTR FAMILY 6.2-like n=1 Tax=Gossypium arboreum TaxID=29729 RepID=UPI0022F1951B|nr:protein NRT1/ PTR FAMILY 6.2-like [Gossypium arboreum]